MSLKRFAMLAAISYHNQQNYNNNNSNNTNYNNNSNSNNNTQTTVAATTFVTTTTAEPTTKIIFSNKSTLIQLKQQQQQQQTQQQSQQIILPTSLTNTNTTTATTTTTIISRTHKPLYTDKIISHRNNQQQHNGLSNDDFNSDIIDDSSSNYSSESSESLDSEQHSTNGRQPSNTYTSTTYYGSGFGVFHQQNIRSNGGGIALITGNGGNNGLGSGSYSNGINNNVNLLLGGAMLTLITTILCVVCYCCHRNIKKRTEAAYRQQRQWLENDPNMEIYSVEQCYETSGLFVGDSMDGLATIPALHHEPPPSYDAVVAMQEQQQLLIHQQQQLMMQQQLLQQQLPTNNSPPPGYRSSLDVSSIIQQGRANGLAGNLGVGGSIISGMEINSLASSTTNIRNATSHSPIDPLLNYNDHNGNVATALPVTTVTPTNTHSTTASYLRNKTQHQQQRNLPTNQLSQLNMKKVLQAQSCCSLQRAEVENMWNAAAAALAARSTHLASDSRASTTASTSSPTLAMNTRKLSQGYSNNSKLNTPETFGSRYLKQNYYRRGCPLCGKFRYDNDSTLSISMESNLDTLAGVLSEDQITNGQEKVEETNTINNNLNNNNNNNNNDNLTNNLDNIQNDVNDYHENENNNDDENDDDDVEEEDNDDNELEQQCSCSNSKRKTEIKLKQQNRYQKVNTQQDNNETQKEQENIETPILDPKAATADANANSSRTITTEQQLTIEKPTAASNNNNDLSIMELPTTSNIPSIPRSPLTTTASTSSAASTPSVTINLDCINENGIISLDMSKIIDKTGLPTYDAALKLESSGYV